MIYDIKTFCLVNYSHCTLVGERLFKNSFLEKRKDKKKSLLKKAEKDNRKLKMQVLSDIWMISPPMNLDL